MTDYLKIASQQLEIDEGRRNKPYKDSEGILTIGIGRNLDQVGLREDEILFLFKNDLVIANRDAMAFAGNAWDALSDVRKAVLVNMAFNLGYKRLMDFRNFRTALTNHDFVSAAYHMKNSKWYTQVGERAQRLVAEMRAG